MFKFKYACGVCESVFVDEDVDVLLVVFESVEVEVTAVEFDGFAVDGLDCCVPHPEIIAVRAIEALMAEKIARYLFIFIYSPLG